MDDERDRSPETAERGADESDGVLDPDELRDRVIPAAGVGSGTAPHLETATLLGQRYDEDENREGDAGPD